MKKVFIGVGHGGKDPGAIANGFNEKDVNLEISLALRDMLQRSGVNVAISREKDESIALGDKIRLCNRFAPDAAIEVHCNAGGGKGFEVMCQTNQYEAGSKRLGMAIESQVIEIGQSSRGCKTRKNEDGEDYFGWLRSCNCPAVLCEAAFLDNNDDCKQIDTVEKQRAFGMAYAKGVLDYLGVPGGVLPLTPICGQAACTALQMSAYLKAKNPDAPDYAEIYLAEAKAEGIRGDIAFAQSILETGFFRFGGDVKKEQNNFCGLGATGAGACGHSFATPEEGIRAQIQHLKAYACNEPLSRVCVDPRFAYVTRGAAEYVDWLGISDNPLGKGWAAGQGYGARVLAILKEMQSQSLGGEQKPKAEAPPPLEGERTQRLIMPINKAKLTASMKTDAYRNTFGFEHYGADFVSVAGNQTIYASGRGTVVAAGSDSIVGKVVAVHYTNAVNRKTGEVHDVIFRYYHLADIKTSVGDAVNKDTVLGLYGNTGSLKMGLHLHLEADTDTANPLHSPTVNNSSFLKGRSHGANDRTMSSPLEWLHVKTSMPDCQTFTTTKDAYISESDKSITEVE